MPNRPPIPDPIKREVRQRCGFGCVICGLPLYVYDHIQDWAECGEHDPANLTLLCDSHHREKTNGLLTRVMVSEFDANPKNIQQGISAPFALLFSGKEFLMEIGGNTMRGLRASRSISYTGIRIDGLSVLEFTFADPGELYLTVKLFGNDNKPILTVVNNELEYLVETWDITFVGTRLTIRHKPRQIFFDIVFDPPGKVAINRGLFLYNGKAVRVDQTGICYLNRGNSIGGCEAELCKSLVEVGQPRYGGFFYLGD